MKLVHLSELFKMLVLEYPVASEAHPRQKKGCHGKKHANMYNIMGIGEPSHSECSLHDSDIDNMNRVILKSAG